MWNFFAIFKPSARINKKMKIDRKKPTNQRVQFIEFFMSVKNHQT